MNKTLLTLMISLMSPAVFAKSIASDSEIRQKCIIIGTKKEDGKTVYSCPEGVLDKNVVGHIVGGVWAFNEKNLEPIKDKVGIIYNPVQDPIITQKPKPTKEPVTLPETTEAGIMRKCILIGTKNDDKKPVYSCPEGVLDKNVVGHTIGNLWAFNEKKLQPIRDKVGVTYFPLVNYDPGTKKDPSAFSEVENMHPKDVLMLPSVLDLKTDEYTIPMANYADDKIPVLDTYPEEPYSESAFAHKTVEFSAAIWALREFNNVCQFGSEKAKMDYSHLIYGVNQGINLHQMAKKELDYALATLKARPISTNQQIEALNFQMNSLRAINLATIPINKLKNYFYYYAFTHVYIQKAKASNGETFEKLAEKYRETILTIENNLKGCDPRKHSEAVCQNVKEKSDALVAKLQEYATAYQAIRVPSSELNQKLMAIEKDLPLLAAQIPGDYMEKVHKKLSELMIGRVEEMMICPVSPEKLEQSAADYAKNVGIEINQKNIDTFIGIWKEMDSFIGQSRSRQIILHRADRFVTQIKKWAHKAFNDRSIQQIKIGEARKKLRATLGLPANETLAEAQARITNYIKNHPDFVSIIKKTVGTDEYYMAQMKNPDGTLYELELSTDRGAPNLCINILPSGCKPPMVEPIPMGAP